MDEKTKKTLNEILNRIQDTQRNLLSLYKDLLHRVETLEKKKEGRD